MKGIQELIVEFTPDNWFRESQMQVSKFSKVFNKFKLKAMLPLLIPSIALCREEDFIATGSHHRSEGGLTAVVTVRAGFGSVFSLSYVRQQIEDLYQTP